MASECWWRAEAQEARRRAGRTIRLRSIPVTWVTIKNAPMDVGLFAYLWRFQFALPALVSGGLLAKLWAEGRLFGISGTVFCAWFAVAALAQFLMPTGTVWSAGLVAQVALAIVLLLKNRLEQIS
jgi:hypothetical protein